jgi:FkbM family methyltransferase
MSFSRFLYRVNQKWKYHTAGNLFDKKVAEINRHERLVFLYESTFKIGNSELVFNKDNHSFIIDRFELFVALMAGRGKFIVSGVDLLYVIDAIILRITTAEEIFIIHEIYFEHCYNVIPKEDFNVIDIGMNVGYASLFFAANDNVKKVVAFEPFKPTFKNALFNFSLNPKLSDKIVANNFGLGLADEKLTLNYSSNLKGKNSITSTGEGKEEIELKGAAKVIDEIIDSDTTKQYFVKVDCEGSEFEIFDSLRAAPIRKEIFGFIIEWHFKSPQPILNLLLNNNFKVYQNGNSQIGLIIAFK